MTIMRKTYTDLIKIPSFIERYNYLKLEGIVCDPTFGGYRYLNQILYQTAEWKRTRRDIILRDDGCDLGHPDYPISYRILVHHINPITIEDILERHPCVFDPENLICSSHRTHNAIHYGDDAQLELGPIDRSPNDTCPWR